MSKKKKHVISNEYLYDDSDDMFAFIAGYTDGGAPYGITWEEEGMDIELSFEEKVRIYYKKIDKEMSQKLDRVEIDKLPFD